MALAVYQALCKALQVSTHLMLTALPVVYSYLNIAAMKTFLHCSTYGWCCRSYTGLCHKLRLDRGPAFLPLQLNVPMVLAAGPTVSRVFLEGRCSQAGFSDPLLSSLITEMSSSASSSTLSCGYAFPLHSFCPPFPLPHCPSQLQKSLLS